MIKRGYQVKIESYGGDLDWYNTYIQDGLTFEDAKWLHHFFDAYFAKSQHEHDNYDQAVLEAINTATEKLGYMWSDFANDTQCIEDLVNDIAYTVLGAACEYSGRWNTVTKMEVHYFPVDIQECSDTLWHE